MKVRRATIGHISFFTRDAKEYYGTILCKIGLHDTRLRKNGKNTEKVCKRKYCEYCIKETPK